MKPGTLLKPEEKRVSGQRQRASNLPSLPIGRRKEPVTDFATVAPFAVLIATFQRKPLTDRVQKQVKTLTMTYLLKIIAFIIVTYIVFGLGVFSFASRFLRLPSERRIDFFTLSFPLTPFILSLVLAAFYSAGLTPPPFAMISVVIGIGAFGCFIGRGEITALAREFHSTPLKLRPENWLFVLLLAVILTVIIVQAMTMPLMENDSLEYLAVAKHIFEAGTLAVYPITSATEQGLFAPPSHPPAYHLLLIWGYTWFGTSDFLHVRLLALFVLIGMAMLFANGLRGAPRGSTAIALLLLLCTPLFTSMLVGYHIDSVRLLAFLGAALAVARLVGHPGSRSAIMAGLAIGLAALAHSTGVLAIAFGGLAWLLLGPKGRFTDWRTPLIVGAVVLVVGGWHYIKNVMIFGVPLHDTLPIWEMPELDFATELRYRRDLLVLSDRLLFGVLRSFTELPVFGLLFWLLLIALWRAGRHWSTTHVAQRVAIVWAVSYFIVALATALLRSELVIKNPRYVLTMAPLAVLAVAPLLASALARRRWASWAVILLAIALPGWVSLQSLWRISQFAGRIDIYTAGERAPIQRQNDRFPGAAAYRYLEQNHGPGEKTLVFRQADFTLYGTGDWIDNFDDRMMPFYRLKDVDAGMAWLQERGVRYLLLPWYFFPTASQTIVNDIVGDDRNTELVATARGYALYRLRDAPAPSQCVQVGGEQVEMVYQLEQRSVLGTAIETAGIPAPLSTTKGSQLGSVSLLELDGKQFQERGVEIATAHSERIALATWRGPLSLPPLSPYAQINPGDGTIALSMTIKGKGHHAIEAIQYVKVGETVEPRSTVIWEGRAFEEPRQVKARFKPAPDALAFRFIVRKFVRAAGLLDVSDLSICRTTPLRIRPEASAPVGEAVTKWRPDQFAPKCWAQSECASFVRKSRKSSDETWSNGLILGTNKSPLDWRFHWRARLETARLFVESYPESTLAQLLRPALALFEPAAANGWTPYVVAMSGSGSGVAEIFVEYTARNGELDWRYVGITQFAKRERRFIFNIKLPEYSGKIEILMIKSASNESSSENIEIKDIGVYKSNQE